MLNTAALVGEGTNPLRSGGPHRFGIEPHPSDLVQGRVAQVGLHRTHQTAGLGDAQPLRLGQRLPQDDEVEGVVVARDPGS
jgi:hypothetical protein